jgi:ubiquinone/menaquinone biosynthesis C-methylase UbiE
MENRTADTIVIKDDFYNGDVSFQDQYFDVSFNNGVIEHFENPVKAIQKMKRISKKVVCAVPAKSIYFTIGTLIRRLIEKDASHWISGTTYYTMKEFRSFFESAALKNIQSKTIRFFGLPLCHVVAGDSL